MADRVRRVQGTRETVQEIAEKGFEDFRVHGSVPEP
jgi:hypothetical protein